MADFNVRADGVDVEQIMRQIRSRIRDKRGVDYTEDQIQELAKVKLEKFLDARGLRSDLLDQFRALPSDVPPIYPFDDQTLFASSKPLVRFFRKLLNPLLKLMFNPNSLNHVLHTQAGINDFLMKRAQRDALFYEVVHNLVVEVTRATIEVKNMKMRVESISSRLEFNERRARALEAVVQYKPDNEVAHRGSTRSSVGGADRGARPQDRDRDRDRERGREPGRDPARRSGGDAAPAHRVVHSRSHQAPDTAAGASEAHPNPPDPLTGGDSLRSRRKRRRRGRRSGPGFTEGAASPGEGSPVNAGEGTPSENPLERTPVNTSEGTPSGNPIERTPVADSPVDGGSDSGSSES
jgi:hypothetical protein